jgi:hypothetical protein
VVQILNYLLFGSGNVKNLIATCKLSQIWAMGDKSFHVVDNLHGVIAAAASKLGYSQIDHLLHLVQEVYFIFNDRCFIKF